MSNFEEFFDVVEFVPDEMRANLTKIRELDLKVSIDLDKLDERMKFFFANAKKMKQKERDAEFKKIRQIYNEALKSADEKVEIANESFDMADKSLKQLDQELKKLKEELEAEKPGITEILEKQSLEPDNPPSTSNLELPDDSGKKKQKAETSSKTSDADKVDADEEDADKADADKADADKLNADKLNADGNSESSEIDVVTIQEDVNLVNKDQLYCICKKKSYGDMIACDAKKCPIEWFHFECAGITKAPKRRWFCSSCLAAMKNK